MEVMSGDNWSYRICKAPVSQIITTSKLTQLFTGRPTNSVKALTGKVSYSTNLLTSGSPGGFQPCLCSLKAPGYQASRQPMTALNLVNDQQHLLWRAQSSITL